MRSKSQWEGRDLTLLCSAAATGLTPIGKKLGSVEGIEVRDLEDVLKTDTRRVNVWEEPRLIGTSSDLQTMGTVCTLPRERVLHYWSLALNSALADLACSKKPHAVLACHLTLYNPERLEFYAPPVEAQIRAAAEHAPPSIRRVVVLVDDVYDMYARLAVSGLHLGVHGDLEVRRRTGKLTGMNLIDCDATTAASLAVTARIKALLHLLQWRRSEMVVAETLARGLGADLTVLGVKHPFGSLRALVSGGDVWPIYVSHKISEPRRQGKGNDLRPPEYVDGVNALSRVFLSEDAVAIQPTVIDELRFKSNPKPAGYAARFTLELGARWPLPDGSMYVPPEGGPDHRRIVSGQPSTITSSLGVESDLLAQCALLQHAILDEIAFRDHLLVNSNRGLFVYRPSALMRPGEDISAGMEQEIRHWADSTYAPVKDRHRTAFVHVVSELWDFLLEDEPRQVLLQTGKIAFERSLEQKGGLPTPTVIERVWAGDPEFEQAEIMGAAKPLGVPGAAVLEKHLQETVRSCLARGVVVGISAAFKVSSDAAYYCAHFPARGATEGGDEPTLSDATSRAIRYLKGDQEAQWENLNLLFIASLASHCGLSDVHGLLKVLHAGSKV